MPRDFKSFAKENSTNTNSTDTSKYENIINKYKNMSSNELMQNLFTEASKLKSEGKLTENSLNMLKTNLSPFLNNEQQSLLNDLVNAINEQK